MTLSGLIVSAQSAFWATFWATKSTARTGLYGLLASLPIQTVACEFKCPRINLQNLR